MPRIRTPCLLPTSPMKTHIYTHIHFEVQTPLVITGGPQDISIQNQNNWLTVANSSLKSSFLGWNLENAWTPRHLFGLAFLDLPMEVEILLTYYIISDERTLNGEIDWARFSFYITMQRSFDCLKETMSWIYFFQKILIPCA